MHKKTKPLYPICGTMRCGSFNIWAHLQEANATHGVVVNVGAFWDRGSVNFQFDYAWELLLKQVHLRGIGFEADPERHQKTAARLRHNGMANRTLLLRERVSPLTICGRLSAARTMDVRHSFSRLKIGEADSALRSPRVATCTPGAEGARPPSHLHISPPTGSRNWPG